MTEDELYARFRAEAERTPLTRLDDLLRVCAAVAAEAAGGPSPRPAPGRDLPERVPFGHGWVGIDEPIAFTSAVARAIRGTARSFLFKAAGGVLGNRRDSRRQHNRITLRWVCGFRRADLLASRRVGDSTVATIEAWLAGMGLSLLATAPDPAGPR